MAKIYERLLSLNIRQGKSWDWLDPRGQNLSAEDSNCVVEHRANSLKDGLLHFSF